MGEATRGARRLAVETKLRLTPKTLPPQGEERTMGETLVTVKGRTYRVKTGAPIPTKWEIEVEATRATK